MTRPGQAAPPARAGAPVRFYGRRRGKALRPGRRRLLAELLPRIRVPDPARSGRSDPFALFPAPVSEVWLEIGFGAGEHLAWQAGAHPDIGFIGCEPYLNGVAALLAEIERRGLTNVRVFPDDARLLLPALPEASVGRAFILFPDPWPKARHAKRRLVNDATLAELARILDDGAGLRIATDDAGHLRWILACVARRRDFAWLARRSGDCGRRPDDGPETRYEAKARREGRTGTFLDFRRGGRLGRAARKGLMRYGR